MGMSSGQGLGKWVSIWQQGGNSDTTKKVIREIQQSKISLQI